jgi:23S rRNA (guanosine2251-2'-O)-methyltransferase
VLLYTGLMDVIFGIHAVQEAVKSRGRSLEFVAFQRERHDARLQKIINLCRANDIPSRFESREHLTRLAKSSTHQGVVAVTAAKDYHSLEDILAAKKAERHFVVVLDGVEDPHNLGALLRTADATAADGVIIPERRAVGVNSTVAKASAGASEHVPVAKVTNITRTLETLKSENIWTIGLDERGENSFDQVDYTVDCAIVLGAEGKGLHDLVRKNCDMLVHIPMLGKVPSLNVSVAGALVMYEVLRQRRAKR